MSSPPNSHDHSGTTYRDAIALPVPDNDALRFLPEGPVPLCVKNHLSWVGIQHGADIHHGSINILDLSYNTNVSIELPGRPGFAFACGDPADPGPPSRFMAGVERSLGIFELKTKSWEPFCDGIDEDVENTIINDGIIFEDNIIFGTKDLQFETKKAGLYLYRGRDKKLIRLRDDQICSNGKMIRRDEAGQLKLVDIDSPTRLIVQYDLDIENGTIGEPETLVDLTGESGVPDGAVLTPDGNGVIVSMFSPASEVVGQTRWYDLATADLRCVWRTAGSPQNTCPALVVHDGQIKLVITTAVENMSPKDRKKCPNAGRIFIAVTDFTDAKSIAIPVYPA